MRSVPAYSRSEIDKQQLFDFYRDDQQEYFCQMCFDPMPFVKRNGESTPECVDIFTKPWADETGYDLKVVTSLNVVLCPVCSEVYREYVHRDIEKQNALFKHLSEGSEDDFEVCPDGVRKDEKDRTLRFNRTHLDDIKDILEGDLSSSDLAEID